MMFYGEGFAPFLEGFPPAAGLPYLPDVARLEYARRLAYHAADDTAADTAVLGGLHAAALMEARLSLQAACHVLRSAHPVHAIWRFNATEDKTPVRPAAEDVLVSRPGESVLVQLLPPGGAAFLLALQAGEPAGPCGGAGRGRRADVRSRRQSRLDLFGAHRQRHFNPTGLAGRPRDECPLPPRRRHSGTGRTSPRVRNHADPGPPGVPGDAGSLLLVVCHDQAGGPAE